MRVGSVSPFRPVTGAATRAAASGAATFPLPARASGQAGAAPAVAMLATAPLVLAAGDAMERRRQGARRGRAIVEALDALKLAMLSGQELGAALDALAAANGTIDAGDDPVLAGLLDAIGLRADVELAKASQRRAGR